MAYLPWIVITTMENLTTTIYASSGTSLSITVVTQRIWSVMQNVEELCDALLVHELRSRN